MEETRLQAEPRSIVGKQVRQLRRKGWFPAVLYGKDFTPVALQVEERAWHQVFAAGGARGLLELRIAGEETPRQAVVREVQRDPISRRVLHVDFQQVLMTENLRTEVPIVVVGTSPIVARAEGILITGLTEVEIECLPGDIPAAIEVDISALDAFGEPITVADLSLPKGVKVLTDPEEMVITVVPAGLPEEEAKEVVPEAEPEVIRKGKEVAEEPDKEEK